MMGPIKMVSSFWERAQAQGSRSTVLRPLGWLLVFCATSAITSASVQNSAWWLTLIFGVGSGLSVLLYLAAYCYCLLKAPETLRTERYSIQKLAIEKGFLGDSLTGLIPEGRSSSVRALPTSISARIEAREQKDPE